MVNKFEDFDSLIDFSPQTTGKKKELFLQMLRHLMSSAKKICQTGKILNSNVSHIKMCKYISSNAFRIFSICVFQRIYLHRHYYTTKLIKYIISLFFFEGFPNFWKIIDPLNLIIIGFRMQFVELKIDISSDNSSCWLRHPKVVLVYYFTCFIVIYHVQSLPFFWS